MFQLQRGNVYENVLAWSIKCSYCRSRIPVFHRQWCTNRGKNALDQAPPNAALATFAGGCFWCIEAPFDKVPGVYFAISGYTGGTQPNPTYKEVSTGQTDHIESMHIAYDPEKITYSDLLGLFWQQFDPTDAGGSFTIADTSALRPYFTKKRSTAHSGRSIKGRPRTLRSFLQKDCDADSSRHGFLSS